MQYNDEMLSFGFWPNQTVAYLASALSLTPQEFQLSSQTFRVYVP